MWRINRGTRTLEMSGNLFTPDQLHTFLQKTTMDGDIMYNINATDNVNMCQDDPDNFYDDNVNINALQPMSP